MIHHRHRFAILNGWKVYYVKVSINMIYVDTKWWKDKDQRETRKIGFVKCFISCEWVSNIHISTIFDFYTKFCFKKNVKIYNGKRNHFRVESVFEKKKTRTVYATQSSNINVLFNKQNLNIKADFVEEKRM